MSMFHELMMRKKEEIMYATIKGTLTENDGVFSGFSASNYLQLQQNLKNVDINEIVLKINIPSSSLNQSRYMSALYGCISITTYSGTSAFTYSVINTSGLGDLSIGTLQPDTDYWIKYVNDGTNCSAWLSEDGISFTKKSEKSSTLITETSANNYIGGSGSRYFGGSIDLNRSYIKLGSTKYNLQAVVGYTIVGSPTITDGVVSGFSDSDYVLLNENIPFATGDVFIEMKYSVTSLSGTTLLGTYGSSRMQLKYSSNKLEFYWAGNQIINFSGFNLVDYQYIRVVSNYQGGTLEIYASVDGNNWSLITSASNVNWNYSQTYPTQFGRYPVSSDFAIDFNNTYIKLDGKLWFNGQQA